MKAVYACYPLLARTSLLLALVLSMAGCEKEEERRCGMGRASPYMGFQVVDERNGTPWPSQPYPHKIYLGEKAYYLPTAGGDLTDTHVLRLSDTDTDTLEVRMHFGALVTFGCQPINWLERLEIYYNGRANSSYQVATGKMLGEFYCNGCEPVVVLRKRP